MATYPQIHPARTMALAVVSPSPNHGGEAALINACAEYPHHSFPRHTFEHRASYEARSAWGNPSYCWVGLLAHPSG
jgi:hypothetical protein